MSYLHALILSIVEGITEFLPISSTGHLILASELLSIPQTEFVKTFEIAIQAGAILSVVVLYFQKFLKDREVVKRIIWTAIPTGILGFILYTAIKSYLIGNALITVSALFFGGIVIIIFEKYFKIKEGKGTITELSLKNSLLLGLIQTLSVIPGVSRSATTIFGGMFLGLSRKEATELSFLVAVPIMAAATGLDLLESYRNFTVQEFSILSFGVIASFVAAYGTVKWLLQYVKTHDFMYFGIYRIILALIFYFFVL